MYIVRTRCVSGKTCATIRDLRRCFICFAGAGIVFQHIRNMFSTVVMMLQIKLYIKPNQTPNHIELTYTGHLSQFTIIMIHLFKARKKLLSFKLNIVEKI